MNPSQILTLIDKIMDFAAKQAGRKSIDSLTGKDDPFDIDAKLPGPLSKVGRIKGLNGAEVAADEIVSKLREAGVDPKDINYDRIVNDIEKRVLKDGEPLEKVKDSVFDSEKKRIDVQNTGPMPSPGNAGGPADGESGGPGFGDNGPSGQDDDTSDDTPSGDSSGDGQNQSARLPDPGDDTGNETKDFTPEQNNLLKDFDKNDGPLDEILAKDPGDLTQGEFLELKKAMIDLPAGPEQERLDELATAFLDDKFGTGPAEVDAVGRMIDPKPIRPINKDSVPARTPDGEPLTGALNRIGKTVAGAAGGQGPASAVQGLQSGLNILRQALGQSAGKPEGRTPGNVSRSQKSRRPPFSTILVPELKADGVVGPKTRRALRFATSRLGTPKIEEGFALGRFGRFAQGVQTGRDDTRNLGATVGNAFGPLFRNPKAPR